MKPLPLILFCEKCHRQHVDEGEWATKVHSKHLCAYCKHEWKDSPEPTVGIVSHNPEPVAGCEDCDRGVMYDNVFQFCPHCRPTDYWAARARAAEQQLSLKHVGERGGFVSRHDHEAILQQAIVACQTNLGKWAYKDEIILAKLLESATAAYKKLPKE